MKLLVFAHTPPPYHGQSYMVQLMVDGFGGDCRSVKSRDLPAPRFQIDCYHVNARLSQSVSDIGSFQFRKLPLLLGRCIEAIWCRFRYGTTYLYYVPAPAKHAALYRDWLVMLLCRPFFKKVVYHWHAAGLTEWLEQSASPLTRWVTWRLLGRPELSIVLSDYNAADGKKIGSRQTRIVHNGIPDPCADFEQTVLPARRSRLSARRELLAGALAPDDNSNQPGADTHTIRLLYLSLCSREKGLFDILEAVAIGNQRLSRSKSLLRLHLSVAGEFVEAAQKDEFERRIGKADLQMPEALRGSAKSGRIGPAVEYLGFLSGENKRRILIESDCLCFPTYYHAESFGLVLIEAMAFGLPIVATRWRSIPEVLPNGYAGLVDIRSPEQIANAIEKVVAEEWSEKLRGAFLAQFTLERHLTNLAGALLSL